jgi:hypothetical protein
MIKEPTKNARPPVRATGAASLMAISAPAADRIWTMLIAYLLKKASGLISVRRSGA